MPESSDSANSPKRVGKPYLGKVLYYRDVPRSQDGWVDPKKFLPKEHELRDLLIERIGRSHMVEVIGWSTGSAWDGYKLFKDDKVIKWRVKNEDLLLGFVDHAG